MEQNKSSRFGGISSFGLHLLAMVLMVLDHLWGTVVPGNDWMTCLGRIAYPIFAFCTVEGYFHTRSFPQYMLRLLIFAAVSEVPFDLLLEGIWLYPFQQNVLWTFLLALMAVHGMEMLRKRKAPWLAALLSILLTAGILLTAMLSMTDYGSYGVLMVLVFYLFRGRRWYHKLLQAAGLFYINWFLMKGQVFLVTLWGMAFELPRQGLAVLAMLPICCYQGRQGPHNKTIQYAMYAFYPVHMLVLWGLRILQIRA